MQEWIDDGKGETIGMESVLITGAAGYLGSTIVRLAANSERHIIAIDVYKERIPKIDNVEVLSNDEWFQKEPLPVNSVVNCAFARGNDVAALVSALDFNEELIQRFIKMDLNAIINISSQGLYKPLGAGKLSDERALIEPTGMYALAKYAQERLFTTSFKNKVTNIRMASLSGNARFLVYFVDCAIQGKDITVTAPNQYVSLIDVSDAATGIMSVCELPNGKRKSIYNLGTGLQYSILELAQIVKRIGKKKGFLPIQICVEDKGIHSAAGVNPTALKKDTGWKPKTDIEEMVEKVFENRRDSYNA